MVTVEIHQKESNIMDKDKNVIIMLTFIKLELKYFRGVSTLFSCDFEIVVLLW